MAHGPSTNPKIVSGAFNRTRRMCTHSQTMSGDFLAELAKMASTKEDFKKALVSKLDSMATSDDTITFERTLRQIAQDPES